MILFLRCIRFVSLVSLVSWIPLLLVNRRDGDILRTVELPLKKIQNVIVDSQDRVFVGVGFYGRVQVYDSTGRFLHGFFAISSGGRTRLGFDAAGNVVVALGRSDTTYKYSDQGKLLSTGTGSRATRADWEQNTPWTRDSSGRAYEIHHPGINPGILTVAPNGDEKSFVATPFYLWPFVASVPCIISVLATSVLLRFLKGADSLNDGNASASDCPIGSASL